MAAQGEYKDRLFSFIFGSEAHRDWTLSLYNAVNGTRYTDASTIEFTTIRETLYLGMRNDVSFLIVPMMSLYEQQSTYNPNMPLRFLQYAGNIYERYVVERKKNKYGTTRIMLPVPKLVVFYNGLEERPDQSWLYLSDAFDENLRDQADIQVRVKMLNVNAGRSPELLRVCKPLSEYAWIVDRVRTLERALKGTLREDKLLEAAIDQTIDELPEHFETRLLLEAHRAEVKGMLLTEYNETKAMELFKEEGREEGMDLLSTLIFRLIESGRSDDVLRVTQDSAYRNRLLKEFNLA